MTEAHQGLVEGVHLASEQLAKDGSTTETVFREHLPAEAAAVPITGVAPPLTGLGAMALTAS